MTRKKGWVLALYLFAVGILVIADQVVKRLCMLLLKPVGSVTLLDGIFALTYKENTGGAFSLLSGHRWLLIAATAVLMGICLYLLVFSKDRHPLFLSSIALIIAGGIGNFIDRLFRGYVVDMFEFRFVNFAVFNVADICVTVGVALLAVYILFVHRADKDGEKHGGHAEDSADC